MRAWPCAAGIVGWIVLIGQMMIRVVDVIRRPRAAGRRARLGLGFGQHLARTVKV